MLILLEANYPIPLIKALQAAMLAYPKETVTVLKDSYLIEEDANSRTIVFMINRDKKRIAPAIRQRCEQGYYVFALRASNNKSFDPFQLTIQMLSMLPKIIDVIESDTDPFLYQLQLQKRLITKVTLAPIKQAQPPKPTVKRNRRIGSRVDTAQTVFPYHESESA